MAKYTKKVKFEPSVPLKRPDHLASSDYGHVKPFRPSYDNRCDKPNLFYLFAMEYQRMWQREKLRYTKEISVSGGLLARPPKILTRRHVPKGVPPLSRAPECPAPKRTTKYDHVRSRYKDVTVWRPDPRAPNPGFYIPVQSTIPNEKKTFQNERSVQGSTSMMSSTVNRPV